MEISVKVLYFGQVCDASGRREELLSLPEKTRLRTMLDAIFSRNSELGKMRKTLQVAINEEIAEGDPNLREGDVVALLPPVAGG